MLIKIDGVKKFEISLRPANFWQYLKFLFSRQSHHNSIKKIIIQNKNGIMIEPEASVRRLNLLGCFEDRFYILKNGEYLIECHIDEKCDGWHLGYKIKGFLN